ncbi:MFS general substrate transporter [Mycena pura]|uniref:MFS general substrate transporter n=1 Tax=Mycena pura TaxID=153505 RepID=A0AAD6YQC1_9AGAR|nr:MFS general substrate transporter [Mycena pura]
MSSTTENTVPTPGAVPFGLKWRCSFWFTTAVIGLSVATDLLVYSMIIPVMPFQLEWLGYHSVSALTGWLLFAYSAGLVLCTIPVAMLSERYNARRYPFIFGLFVIIGSQIMLMEAPNYAVMCVARVLQGVGSTMVWVVGLALLYVCECVFAPFNECCLLRCDSTPEQYIGRQLGLAMSGMSIGFLAGPPIGGALYARFGFRGPFICGIVVSFVDLVGRLLIIERKEALRWNLDPAAVVVPVDQVEHGPADEKSPGDTVADGNLILPVLPSHPDRNNVSFVAVIARLFKSSRATVVILVTLLYGIIYSAQEPTLPLHLQAVWGLDSRKVGLVYIAGVVPTLFSAPITGVYSDRHGIEWLLFICLTTALPWWVTLLVQRSLALFIVSYALGSFFISGVLSPVMVELASVSRNIEGVGYGHVYGAFNLVYGIGMNYFIFHSARTNAQTGTTVGPVVGGQMYAHSRQGWLAISLLSSGLLVGSLALTFCYTGDDPMLTKLMRRLHKSQK